MRLASVCLALSAAPVLAATGYLALLALLSRRSAPKPPSAARRRFEVVVPAHDEEAGIAQTVRSLLALDWPRELYSVTVVADNCSDRTAERAAAAGADVLVRRDPARRGKGHALAYAFAQSPRAGRADAVVVVDADTVVSKNLLRAFDVRLGVGARAVQADYAVRNAEASWRTRLMAIALAMFHVLRSLGRERLGLSCGLRGNGMCFARSLLDEVPHDAFSVVEDVEYGVRLGEAGIRVWYAGEAHVYGEMVAKERASRSQRQRWEGGRLALARRHGLRLLGLALRRRDPVLLDLGLDLLIPPLSTLAWLTMLGLAASAALSVRGHALSHAAWPWMACAGLLAVYVARGWQLSGAGPRGLAALAYAPVYVLWKLLLALAPHDDGWIRTTRAGEPSRPDGSPRIDRRRHAGLGLGLLALLVLFGRRDVALGDPMAPTTRSAHERLPGGVDVSASVRCDAPSHPISPLVYGIGVLPMHDGDASHQWRLGATARRWGGNHAERYNWQLGNSWSTAKDWFWKNVDYDGLPGLAHDRFVERGRAHGLRTALTVPILGWVAKDASSYSFPVSRFGAQQATAPENPDIGNGVHADGSLIAPGPPETTSVPMPPEAIGRFVRSLADKASIAMYILGNEPMLWHETHRDVHPEPVSYDELLARTIAYATEIRRADPDAVIAGPALWGWPAYFGSAVDAVSRPIAFDRLRHGGTPLLAWWMRELAARERASGLRLVDVVDVHFYPQGEGLGIGRSGATDRDTSARRIRATRSLWDPDYRDESWIKDTMRVLPRVKAWIAENHPGLGISIGEYNFGAEGHMSGGLALAEALGRFGEQGIRAAFYWDYPEDASPAFWAFRAFRDFDGRGGRFLDQSIPTFANDRQVSMFASRDAGGEHMVLVLLNLDPDAAHVARVDLARCGRPMVVRPFAYAGGPAGLAPAPAPRLAPTFVEPTLPPYSITVLDLTLGPRAQGEVRGADK